MRFFIVILAMLCLVGTVHSQNDLTLWYDKPAQQWEETLPLGNGRLGMMPDGNITNETITLNDITLWSGSPQDANNYEASKRLPEIRQLLLEDRNDEAQAIINKDFICKGKGSGEGNGANVPFGCYQVLGNLHLQFDHRSGNAPVEQYRRELSLNEAIAKCTYRINGVNYTREYFTSFGDDISMIRIRADKPGQLNCQISMDRPERSISTTDPSGLSMYGQLENGVDGKGMRYLAKVRAQLTGGSLRTEQSKLVIRDATEIILYLSAATDYKDPSYQEKVESILQSAGKKTYTRQKQQHVENYKKMFDRLTLSLGKYPNDVPTDQRITNFQKDATADNGLPVLYFQFGRYLSICSTRVGLLPPNLQGLWANQVRTPWNGDYHLDINIQMNQWPVEVVNLSELNLPLADLVQGMVANGEKTAKAYYNAEGWVAHVITNIWGFTEPGEAASWGVTKVGSGWLCNNLWEHYLFTNDEDYLRKIYPILKGAALFYNSILIRDPETGWLVTSPSSSPENGFYLPNGNHASICMGPTIDNQIIRELFNNVIIASKKLGEDPALATRLGERLKQIPPTGRIAPDGRLMEWLKDYKEMEPHHRCISHLYGLFPASLITTETTPALAEACRKSLEARGDDGPSFSIAHKMLWWSRLHDGNRAYKLFKDIVRLTRQTNINYGDGGGIYPNLLSAGPPFQIDGNFGATAGIAEMLIQSHDGFIELLPALPDEWKKQGSIKGIRARGNFTVDMKWENGKIATYKITSPVACKVKVKVNGEVKEIEVRKT